MKRGRPTQERYDKARNMTVMLLTNDPTIKATKVLEYLNMYLGKGEVPSRQHISKNWVNKHKAPTKLTWVQVENINRQIAMIEKELIILKNLIGGKK